MLEVKFYDWKKQRAKKHYLHVIEEMICRKKSGYRLFFLYRLHPASSVFN
ncbi:hypothetical protein ACQKD9_18275 [Bacillus paramycoides]